jgi:hypothetical protein
VTLIVHWSVVRLVTPRQPTLAATSLASMGDPTKPPPPHLCTTDGHARGGVGTRGTDRGIGGIVVVGTGGVGNTGMGGTGDTDVG